MELATDRERWRAVLTSHVTDDVLWAYAALSFECIPWIGTSTTIDQTIASLAAFRQFPIIEFKLVVCSAPDFERLQNFQIAHPRFSETSFFLGSQALAARDVDAADEQFSRAYSWHPDWPVVTKRLGDLAMQSEDFFRAVQFYDRTLAIVDLPDIELGKLQALSQLDQAGDAITLADSMLTRGMHMGEAHYWKAVNQLQLGDTTAAHTDAIEARRVLADGSSAKLAGRIALQLGQLDGAEEALNDAQRLIPYDCEVKFFLGQIARQRNGSQRASDLLADAGACFDKQQQGVLRDIEQIKRLSHNLDRQRRLVDHRVQQITAITRMASEA